MKNNFLKLKYKHTFFLLFLLLFIPHIHAQDIVDTETTFASGKMENKSIAVLQSLDKITARTHKFEVPVGETVKFGTIYILAKSCKKNPPIEQPESAAFLQIWQKSPSKEEQAESISEWIFSGWMFASSPALSAMDHPIYDVWVLDCIDKKNGTIAPTAE